MSCHCWLIDYWTLLSLCLERMHHRVGLCLLPSPSPTQKVSRELSAAEGHHSHVPRFLTGTALLFHVRMKLQMPCLAPGVTQTWLSHIPNPLAWHLAWRL
jgi:hypothetical protein